MAKIKFSGEIRIEVDLSQKAEGKGAVKLACEAAGMEFIGKKISREERTLKVVVKYHETYFFLRTYLACGQCYTFVFDSMPLLDNINNYEDFSEYKYYVDYCNPEVDDEGNCCWYYKENELDEANLKIELYGGEEFAVLHEI